MQTIDPVTPSQLLLAGQVPLAKFEIFHNSAWIDLSSTMKYSIATMTFKSGSVEPQTNEVLTVDDSLATAKVIFVSVVSGTWGEGDAAGTIHLGYCNDRFYDNDNINGSIGGSNILTVDQPDTELGVDGHTINGGMEQVGDENWLALGWVPYGTPISVLRSNEYSVRTGSRNLRIGCNGANEGTQIDTDVYPTLIKGKSYTFSIWVLWKDTEPAPPATVTFRLGVTGDGTAELDTTYGDVAIARATETHHWYEVYFTAKCTKGGTIRLYLEHRAIAPYYPPIFYADDATIYKRKPEKSYLEDFSISLGGASKTPSPISGSWDVTLNNEDSIFLPQHPTSDKKDYFTTGKKVRISIGAKYGGSDYYWQRIIGFMSVPKFSAPDYKVSISGGDYMKLLQETEFKSLVNYWGTSAIFSSIASDGMVGSEIYAEADAMDINNEDDNVDDWDATNCNFASYADDGGGSTYVGRITNTEMEGSTVKNTNVGTLVSGKTYKVKLKHKRSGNLYPMNVSFYQMVGETKTFVGGDGNLGFATWKEVIIHIEAVADGALIMEFTIGDENQEFRLDQFSIQEIVFYWNRYYELPEASKGPYYVTLDGDPVQQGEEDEGWFYEESTRRVFFDINKAVENGEDNLVIYYFTAESPENVVADILVKATFYADRDAALAAMEYDATEITIDKVWFDTGKTLLSAIKQLCERCDYRFHFKYDGTPVFKPKAAPGDVSFTFTDPKHISSTHTYQDRKEIKNRIIIKGMKQAEPTNRDGTMPSELIGEVHDQPSIDEYGERTMTINNYLFQTQASINTMKALLLAEYKDPKWYTDIEMTFLPVPLEMGDKIQWEERLSPVLDITKTGWIRDVKIGSFNTTYVCVLP